MRQSNDRWTEVEEGIEMVSDVKGEVESEKERFWKNADADDNRAPGQDAEGNGRLKGNIGDTKQNVVCNGKKGMERGNSLMKSAAVCRSMSASASVLKRNSFLLLQPEATMSVATPSDIAQRKMQGKEVWELDEGSAKQ